MSKKVSSIRDNVIAHVELVSSAEALQAYPVPAEWICGFANDLFAPKSKDFVDAFTEEELLGVCEYYGRLCAASDEIHKLKSVSVDEILKIPEWRSLMKFAKELSKTLKSGG
jgi:hypothetical protein